MSYIAGDFWRICDVCGFRYRSSMTRTRWDNLIVCDADFETRHPQDFVRGQKDSQVVPDPRPDALASFIGPLTTAVSVVAVAGATTISVDSSVRFDSSDDLGIMLDDGNVQRVEVQSVPDATSIILTSATKLRGSASVGAIVINYSAVSLPDIG